MLSRLYHKKITKQVKLFNGWNADIDIYNHGTSYDCPMIAEICRKKNEELLYVVYTVKKIAENKINIYLERFGNKREYKNSFEIGKIKKK